ncbi:MAG: hypothetical protein AAF149_03330 [Bacteroidota bacterium]
MKDLHFDIIKEQYSEELNRESMLGQKAQVYLSILTVFLSAIIFKIKDLKQVTASLHECEMITLYISFICILISAVTIIKSLGIYEYRKSISLDRLIERIDSEVDDIEFNNRSAGDYIAAIKHNVKINNKRANLLSIALYSIIASFLTILIFILIIIR